MDKTLYYGDNLDILRSRIPRESVDLIYLDPPFNSNRAYNLIFKEQSGEAAPAQLEAFTDTWRWDIAAERTLAHLVTDAPPKVSGLISALAETVGRRDGRDSGGNDMMAYLVMMAARLVELYKVLKPTGSLYLHCDPAASHYLKLVLDSVFGPEHFQSEISWKRSSAHSDATQGRRNFGHIRDVILYYTKGKTWTWNTQHTPYDQEYIDTFYRHVDPESGRRYRKDNLTAAKPGGDTSYEWKGIKPYKGRYWAYSRANMERFEREGRLVYTKNGMPNYKRYLDEMPGVPLQDAWEDIAPAFGNERLGYPTQKPLALLERIISVSSNPGDVVLDPFCGCGTALVAAEKLGRTWLGIDVTHLAIALMKSRLSDSFPGIEFRVEGEPKDVGSAQLLAQTDRYQFQWFALSLVNAKPLEDQKKKGADGGIDGVISFIDDRSGKLKRCLVQVKSGHVQRKDIADLVTAVNRENAQMGLFITLEPSTAPMRTEAAQAGLYHSDGWRGDFPKVQISTVEDLLAGRQPQIPYGVLQFARAERVGRSSGNHQPGLAMPIESETPSGFESVP